MSPAPVRQRPSTQRFPHSWGYFLGAILIFAGIGVAIWGAVSGVTGFADDVRDLSRVIGGDDAVLVDLERGEDVVVYDEADVGVGPFDVRVIRTSDNAVVPTEDIFGGTTYDVDGNSGRARVGFQVPSSDTYRVELDTSVGQIARFAVGGDVGNDRANTVIAGLVWGGILAGVGFLIMVGTMIAHARWRVRDAVLGQVSQAREAVDRTVQAVTPEERSSRAGDAAEQAAGWARERLDQARSRLDATTEGTDARPPWQRRAAERARQSLDQADAALQSGESAVAEAAAGADVPDDLIGRVGEALQRIEDRVASGESLRDIAREERVVAEETAREIADLAAGARDTATERIDATTASLADTVADQVSGAASELSEIAGTALDDVTQQAAVAGDDLATGIAATAGAAGVAASAAVTDRARALADGSPASSLPAPPASSLPAPPTAPAPVAEPEPVVEAVVEPPAVEPEPVVEAVVEPSAVEPEPVVEPSDVEPMQAPDESALALAAPTLAPPPAAQALAIQRQQADVGREDDAVRPATRVDGFSALRPPPASTGILAPPPAAQGRLLAAPVAQPVSDTSGATGDVDGAAQAPGVSDTGGADDGAAGAPDASIGFSLAPPPDYGSLTRS